MLTPLLPPGAPAEVDDLVAALGLLERAGSGRGGEPGAGGAQAAGSAPAAGAARATGRGGGEPGAGGGPDRPYVVLNMVATLDGRATLGGRSAPLSDAADRALFHGLRAAVDAIMVGAGTARAEGYGALVRNPDNRRLRIRRGLPAQPLACVVTGHPGRLSVERLPLLADPESNIAIVTSSDEPLAAAQAQVAYVRARRPDGSVDLRAALAQLRDRWHIGTVLCEGGPHLNGSLLAGELVDELFLSLAPLLAGDPASDEPQLPILAGIGLARPAALELASVLAHESRLFLRYRVLGA